MIEVYELDGGGFGYRVETEFTIVVQEHNPFRHGYVPMTEAEATYFAECIRDDVPIEYEGDPPIVVPEPEPLPPSPVEQELANVKAQLVALEGVINDILMGGM